MKTRFFELYATDGAGGGGGAPAGPGTPPAASGGGSQASGQQSLFNAGVGGGSNQTPVGNQPPAGSGSPVVTKAWREGWISNDGKLDKSAYERHERFKDHKDMLGKYETDEALIDALIHSQSLNGKKGLLPLGPNASDADKQAFNARMREINGVPEKPDGYGWKRPDNIKEEYWDQGRADAVQAILHKHNISPTAAKELLEQDLKYGSERLAKAEADVAAKMEAKFQADLAELQKAFGPNFQTEMNNSRRVAQSLGIDINDPAVQSPKVIKAFAEVFRMTEESRWVNGAADVNHAGNFEQQASDIIHNKANALHAAYHDANHPQHQMAIQKAQELMGRSLALKKRAG